MKNKNSKFKKIGLFTLFFLMFIITLSSVMAEGVPFSLFGEKAHCSDLASDTEYFYNGGLIELDCEDCVVNLYKINDNGWDFVDEYTNGIKVNKPEHKYVVEVYDGCDFSYTSNLFNNGKPDWFEHCPSGYFNDKNGNCLPTKTQMLQNLRDNCDERELFWYNDVCNDVKPTVSQQFKQAGADIWAFSDSYLKYFAILVLLFLIVAYSRPMLAKSIKVIVRLWK